MIKEHIAKILNGECSKTEFTLTGLCLLLSGIVLGMKLAPARVFSLGSFNGNTGCIDEPEKMKEFLKKGEKNSNPSESPSKDC